MRNSYVVEGVNLLPLLLSWEIYIQSVLIITKRSCVHLLDIFRAIIIAEKLYLPSESRVWSAALQDFLHLCLRRNAEERPSAAELLRHPWITTHVTGNSVSAFHPAAIAEPLGMGGSPGVACTHRDTTTSAGSIKSAENGHHLMDGGGEGRHRHDREQDTAHRSARRRKAKRSKRAGAGERSRSTRKPYYSPLSHSEPEFSSTTLQLPRLEAEHGRSSRHPTTSEESHHTDHVSARWTFPPLAPTTYRG